MSVWQGEVWDVAIDLRRASPTFGRWHGMALSAENKHQFFVPPGFAHGFVVLSDTVLLHCGCTAGYAKDHERSFRWNDPRDGIRWPIDNPILSPRDAAAPHACRLSLQIVCRSFSGNENGPWSRCISSTRPSALTAPCRMIAVTGARPPTGLNHALLRCNRHTLRRLHALNPGGELLSRTHPKFRSWTQRPQSQSRRAQRVRKGCRRRKRSPAG